VESYDLLAYHSRAFIRDHHCLRPPFFVFTRVLSPSAYTSRDTAHFLTGFLLHEDPRYQRSSSTNPFRRSFHALAFTVVDRTDSGRNTFAANNFVSAAAGGFVGMGILPADHNDRTRAEQRMASEYRYRKHSY
jgi:hypothetical protein